MCSSRGQSHFLAVIRLPAPHADGLWYHAGLQVSELKERLDELKLRHTHILDKKELVDCITSAAKPEASTALLNPPKHATTPPSLPDSTCNASSQSPANYPALTSSPMQQQSSHAHAPSLSKIHPSGTANPTPKRRRKRNSYRVTKDGPILLGLLRYSQNASGKELWRLMEETPKKNTFIDQAELITRLKLLAAGLSISGETQKLLVEVSEEEYGLCKCLCGRARMVCAHVIIL